MKSKAQPVFVVGEIVNIVGLHRHYRPVIVAIEYGKVTVKTPQLAGSERTFKLNDLEKVKR